MANQAMRSSARRFAFILLLASGLAGCTSAPAVIGPDPGLRCRADRGIGGTGLIAMDRGIGGTGMVAQDRGMGGTGIIGTVTGFGSICVNGFRIAYDDSTPVSIDGAPAGTTALERGVTVAVTANVQNGQMQATTIEVIHALVGPVTAVSDANGTFAVMNVPVNGNFATGTAAVSLAVGDMIAVDGLQRPDGTVDATRIAPANGAMASVRGVVETAGMFSIGGVRAATAETTLPERGSWAVARGVYENGVLKVTRIVSGIEVTGTGRLSVEGYFTADPEGGLVIRGLAVREDAARGLGRSTLERLAAGQRVQILGRRQSDGSLRPETIIVPDRRAPLIDTTSTEAAATPTTAAVTRPSATAATELQAQRGVYGTTTAIRPQVLRQVEPVVVRPNAVERPVRPEVRPEVRPDVRPTRPEAPRR